MKALVHEGSCEVTVKNVDKPCIEAARDAIVRLTAATICGSNPQAQEGRATVESGKAKPGQIVPQHLPLDQAPGAYKNFDQRGGDWTKVVLKPT